MHTVQDILFATATELVNTVKLATVNHSSFLPMSTNIFV